MRYFVILLAVFAVLQTTPGPLGSEPLGVKAALALAVGIFLSGVHHVVCARHYVEILPECQPAKWLAVYDSALLRMFFGIGMLLPESRVDSVLSTLVLLSVVLPFNIRIAWIGNFRGQLIAARWFLWLRVAVHLAWIGWCAWCLWCLTRLTDNYS